MLRNERINSIAGRIMSLPGLRYYQLTTDADRAKFMSDMQEKITNFTTPLVFFTLELNTLEMTITLSMRICSQRRILRGTSLSLIKHPRHEAPPAFR